MFAKATKHLVCEVDTDGSLIPVSRLNDSDSLVPLALVIKRKPYWRWQRPKFLPSDFKLNDVLVGDPMNPVVVETDFLTYNGKVVNNKFGSVEAELGAGNLNVSGAEVTKLESSFGNLKKHEVDLQKLVQDSKSRILDLQHPLIHQTRENNREVMAVVKEQIITTQPCTITEEVQEDGSCSGIFGFNKTIKVSVNEKNKPVVEYDTNVSINIPPKTIIAYGIIELKISRSGHYELCLLPDVPGGFEVDGTVNAKKASVSACPVQASNSLQKELEALDGQFRVLSSLPASTRSSLHQQLRLLLQDPAAISLLEQMLEDLCEGKEVDASVMDECPVLCGTLALVQKAAGSGLARTHTSEHHQRATALTAVYLLVSALDEMSDSALFELHSCCSATTLRTLVQLVNSLVSNKKSSLGSEDMTEDWQRARLLFAACNVTLQEQKDSLITATGPPRDRLPLVLCIAVLAFAHLASPAE